MPRVRWCPLPILCLIAALYSFWIVQISADCWYDDDKHDEGREVATAEPCLNCTCSRGALLCYLRVCPILPNPPPPGCILLHRFRTCCPELICPEMPNGGNGLEARSEPDGLDIPYDRTILANACVANGSIYGPGSAMDSSSLCEYCYCLGGKQICVKPKCLLPIDGCKPMYDPANCCPIHYNCSTISYILKATTTTTPKQLEQFKSGCTVDGTHYVEGGKVLGIGHSVCDNCYCLRGMLRCEPLSCAPPLFGCTPVIKPGECCAASYNCNGTIEIQPEPFYGQYPTVSKEYAKLRKEVQQRTPVTENSNIPFYVIAESHPETSKINQRSPIGTFGTTRQFVGDALKASTSKPFYYKRDSEVYHATTSFEHQNVEYKRPYSTVYPKYTSTPRVMTTKDTSMEFRSEDYLGFSKDAIFSIVDSLLEGRFNRKVDNETDTTESVSETTTSDAISTTEETLKLDVTESTISEQSTTVESTSSDPISTTEDFTVTSTISDENDTTANSSYPVTLKTVTNTTDCSGGNDVLLDSLKKPSAEVTTILPVDANEINKLAEIKSFDEYLTTTDAQQYSTDLLEASTEDDVTEVDLESQVKVSSVTLRSVGNPSDLEGILNNSKGKDNDYEYDYNEPSLPPSLPNLRIIPFVAADALHSKVDIIKHKSDSFEEDHIKDPEFGSYGNLFSPPIETEGGFLPKEPPILENFYENNVNTVPSITNPPSSINCISNGQDVLHGQTIPSESACITCTCFYGTIACQKETCPAPRPGCRKSSVQNLSVCCSSYVCDDQEAPTVVLDRLEGTSNAQEVTVAEGVVTPDPFRDVIHTEPAPNLQSLIVDMMPFLARKPTPPSTDKPTTTTTPQVPTTTANKTEDNFTLDKFLQLLLSSEETTTVKDVKPKEEIVVKTEKPEYLSNNVVENSINATPSGVGLLKLAGCNIYGRMYRVGRIISELSGPCLECKCTEVGVQCKALRC